MAHSRWCWVGTDGNLRMKMGGKAACMTDFIAQLICGRTWSLPCQKQLGLSVILHTHVLWPVGLLWVVREDEIEVYSSPNRTLQAQFSGILCLTYICLCTRNSPISIPRKFPLFSPWVLSPQRNSQNFSMLVSSPSVYHRASLFLTYMST